MKMFMKERIYLKTIENACVSFKFNSWHFDFLRYCPTRQEKIPMGDGLCLTVVDQNPDEYVFWITIQKNIWNDGVEEVGRALWVGSHGTLRKVLTRGQPTGWHPWLASHCLCFRSSKVASCLSLFGACLLKHGFGYFPRNNMSLGIWT